MIHLFKILRIKDWFYPCIGLILFAYVDASHASLIEVIKAVIICSIYLSYLAIHNNATDIEEDNLEKNYFKKNKIKKRTILILTYSTGLMFLGLGIYHDFYRPSLLAIILNTLYSNRPIRLKRFLIPSLIINIYLFLYIYLVSIFLFEKRIMWENLKNWPYIIMAYFVLQYIHFLEHKEVEGLKINKANHYSIPLLISPIYIYLLLNPIYGIFDYMIIALYQIGIYYGLEKSKDYTQARKYGRNITSVMGVVIVTKSFI
ncbi:MAG: hypothetical protein CME63_18355 [Halobacteriovoraceae bacterium]|nr:hypothetical protein [Halobacteriovoraceae bacterium]|tara:strand:- start:2331 stop:3107 length:777 start_codon:yes stop_codon:yes gene_type:complete